MQQQTRNDYAGGETLYTRPAPRPEPLTLPQRESVALHEIDGVALLEEVAG